MWAWPVGIVGNILLFTVFMGSWFGETGRADMLGQAARQIMFIAVSIYGWYRWRADPAGGRRRHGGGAPPLGVVAGRASAS